MDRETGRQTADRGTDKVVDRDANTNKITRWLKLDNLMNK